MAKPNSNPSYLTRNSVGTFVFQIRVPLYIRQRHSSVKPIIRCSLRTKDFSEAVRRSRQKLVMFDSAIQQYSNVDSFTAQVQLITSPTNLNAGCQVVTEFNLVEPAAVSLGAAEPSRQLNDVVADFMAYKLNTGSRAASIKWYRQKVEQFAGIITALNDGHGVPIAMLSIDLMRQYASVMQRYPKHANTRKSTKDMTEAQRVHLVQNNDRDALNAMGIEPMGFQTINHNFTAVRELLRFAERQQLPITSGLADIIPSNKKKRGTKPQVKFNDQDIKALFNSNEYQHGEFKRPADYWVPLLALFGGQTQAELCQLHVDDIRCADNIWFMDINDQHEKLLKTECGRPRQVPIHHRLIELGFLDFVNQCRKKGQTRLFPDELRDDNDKYARYSKRFNRWRARLGITTDSNGGRKTFHSFRHLVSDWLIGNQCHPGVAADIIGHEGKERTETRRTYSDGAWLVEKNKWIQSLDYDLDWSLVRSWNDVEKVRT